MKKLLAQLNPEQRAAVTTTEGPVLVLAGAGSGKTRVITVRIAHLLDRGVPASAILAMTFTNKAAREMRERVAGLVGERRAAELTIGTFHAFCMDVLRHHGQHVGLAGNFTISDGSDQLSILRGVLREVAVGDESLQPGQLQARISLMKNRLVQTEAFLEGAKDDEDELVGRAWHRYDEALRRSRSLDFDDILLYTLKLLARPGAAREHYRERYRYVMVDEYQDTNAPQYGIVHAIAGGHRNLCVVGDDDQSIYGWRGADVGKILSFERDFKGAAVVRLETNYRSTKPILDAANRVIRNNTDRHEKTLRSAKGDGHALQLVVADDEVEEADHVAREIQQLVRERQTRLGEVAVLFRTGPQARVFEAQFRTRGLPYVLVGGSSFFDRKEVRDVLAYLKLVVNPDDEAALLRVINCPPRGLGKTTIDRIFKFATVEALTISEAMLRAEEIEGLKEGGAVAARDLMRLLKTLGKEKDGQRGKLVAFVERVIEAVDYRREVERCYPDRLTCEQRWGAVGEILDFAENHARRRKLHSLATFLHDLSLSADDDETAEDAERRDRVTLMTLHAAKGLEFPRVYLVGLEEGLLPHARSIAEDTVAEERRLCYVGITRAQDRLTLSHTRHRAKYGRRVDTVVSRFLFELRGETPPEDWGAAAEEAPAKGRGKGAKVRKKGVRKAARTGKKAGKRAR